MSVSTTTPKLTSTGLHHITAIAGNAQVNVDFYTTVLGLRLVKKTVNFDAPDVYHLYYGDVAGSPGSILTFFPFGDAAPGRSGVGQAGTIRFQMPRAALDATVDRLVAHKIAHRLLTRYGTDGIALADPDGLPIEIVVAGDGNTSTAFDSIELVVASPGRTELLLMDTFGYRRSAEAEGRARYTVTRDGLARNLDIVTQGDGRRGDPGSGTIHHVAFRASDEMELREWRAHIAKLGFNVTDVIDRQYFKSIYFREPAGILFEIASDPPGFATDEPAATMGAKLMLPPWLEPRRTAIERSLPALNLARHLS